MKKYIYILLGLFFLFANDLYSQCFPAGDFSTASYATGGESNYKQDVLWLTWGAQSAADIYGKHGVALGNGYKSFGTIHIGDGRYLCVTATISNYRRLAGSRDIMSYAPGKYVGDFLDKMYNIGGIGENNKLVNGIMIEEASEASFTVTCTATIDGVPVRLSGMVLGDAESLAVRENFEASGFGEWTIVDLRRNPTMGSYLIRKTNLNNGKQKIDFVSGNDQNTGAVAFLTFSDNAYAPNTLAVAFDVRLKGGGKTAIGLGLLTPQLDNGDAPKSYGLASHLLEAKVPITDNIPARGEGVYNPTTNINTMQYVVGGLEDGINNYLGSTAPDVDYELYFSQDAKGDDNTGPAGPNEEDAWPEELRRFSHKLYYKAGDIIEADIPYSAFKDGYISGWIDFNLNGKFDENERVTVPVAKADRGTVKLSWVVPENRVIRSTYVRLRFGYNEQEVKDPKGVAVGGEVEDHKIYILGPTRTNSALPSKSR